MEGVRESENWRGQEEWRGEGGGGEEGEWKEEHTVKCKRDERSVVIVHKTMYIPPLKKAS